MSHSERLGDAELDTAKDFFNSAGAPIPRLPWSRWSESAPPGSAKSATAVRRRAGAAPAPDGPGLALRAVAVAASGARGGGLVPDGGGEGVGRRLGAGWGRSAAQRAAAAWFGGIAAGTAGDERAALPADHVFHASFTPPSRIRWHVGVGHEVGILFS